MDRTDLRLVPSAERASRPWRAGTLLLALYLCACGILATLMGADAARARDDPRISARETLAEVLRRGPGNPEFRQELIALRDRAARLPLDAQARAAYASVLAGMAESTETFEAAAFHARTAARLAPVTVPVVRAATLVLAQAGEADEAVEQIRKMFTYDPGAAARLLAVLEPHLSLDAVRRAIPDTPRAWLSRSAVLRGASRATEADALIIEAVERWPDNLELRAVAADRAAATRDWTTLARLLPTDLQLPDEPRSANLLIHRARLRAAIEDAHGASADLNRAVALGGRMPWVLLLAGDVWLTLENAERARGMWARALHEWPDDARVQRADTLRRFARLAEREGQAGTALREWREVLRLVPGDREAGLRVHELGGGDP